MRVKDAFDVMVQTPPPDGVLLDRISSTNLHLTFPCILSSKKEVYQVPVHFWMLMGVGLVCGVYWLSSGHIIFAMLTVAFGANYMNKKIKRYAREKAYQQVVLELSPKGGQVYHQVTSEDRDLKAYYNWGELRTVVVQEVPKSKTNPPPYYIHLANKGSDVRLFQGTLYHEHLGYAASMIEALLQQRYRGQVPANWRKKIEELSEPLVVDWSEHLIDDGPS
ncbi:MAG: hypothetical protein AB8E82_02725 [Aureispira sp.]